MTFRARRARNQDGFILLESMLAISLITVILAALGTFALNAVSATSQLRARQAAAQIATSTVAAIGAIPATDLVTGRDTTSVNNQLAAAPTSVRPSLALMSVLSDSAAAAGSGATATVSTAPVPQTLNGVSFSVNTYLGSCVIATGSTSCNATGPGISQVRAVVAVTWQGRGCGSTPCSLVTNTLVNQDDDPVFNLNTANPPLTPAVALPGNQVSTIGGTVSLQLAVTANTGVPPFTWQVTTGTLPVGLTLSASGLVSGVPTLLVTSTPLTVRVTDAFTRTGTGSFTWTVVGPPAVTTPATQTSTVGQPDSLAVVSTCPNSPCTLTLTNTPPGLTINAATGLISGTPTTLGTYATVTVTTTDAGGATASSSPFTWKVLASPTVTTPVTQTSTVGRATSLAVVSTCPNSPCTLTLTNAPPGLTINAATGLISGTPTAVGTYATVTVTTTDAAGAAASSAPFTWKVLPAPTIGAPGTVNATVTGVESVAIPYSCPTATCTIALSGSMPGLGLSATTPNITNNATTSLTVSSGAGTVYVAGTLQTTAVTTGTSKGYAPTLTITDLNLTVTTSSPGAWTAFTKPTVAGLTTRSTTVKTTPNQAIAYTCPNVPCTVVLTNTIPGLGLSATAGVVTANATTTLVLSSATGTFYLNGLVDVSAVPSGTSKVYTPTVTVTDADTISAIGTGTWTVFKAPAITDPGSQAIEPFQNLTLPMAATCPNGGCTWAAAAQVVGTSTWTAVTISATGVITYPFAPAGSYLLRVTVTDAAAMTDTLTFPLAVQTFTLTIPNQTTNRPVIGSTVVTVDVSALIQPPAAGYTYTLTGQPSWLALSANGILTATVLPTSTTDLSITVTVTSQASATSTVSSTFKWTIQ